jgi:hypothetical protein
MWSFGCILAEILSKSMEKEPDDGILFRATCASPDSPEYEDDLKVSKNNLLVGHL